MNGASILMTVFGVCVFFTGLYMFTGHKLEIIAWKAAFKNLDIEGWKNVGKYTMLSSIIIFLIAILALVFGD